MAGGKDPVVDLTGKCDDISRTNSFTATALSADEFYLCKSAYDGKQYIAIRAGNYVRLAMVANVEGTVVNNQVLFSFTGTALKL